MSIVIVLTLEAYNLGHKFLGREAEFVGEMIGVVCGFLIVTRRTQIVDQKKRLFRGLFYNSTLGFQSKSKSVPGMFLKSKS